jgi:hypothetical protein
MFHYPAYHLILHWNHYLCSSALSHWLATVSPLTVLGTSSRFLCSCSYPFLSFFGDDDYIGCLDGGVSVSLYQTNTKTNTLEPNTCVNLEVLITTTNSNTNIYHPNTAIRDDVCWLCVSFNSTLESLPLQLCSQPLTSNSFLTVLGTFPAVPVLLILSLPCFSYKKAPTPIGPSHFKLLPSSLDLAIWFLLLIGVQ